MKAYEAAGLVGKFIEAEGTDWSGSGLVVQVEDYQDDVLVMFEYGYGFPLSKISLKVMTPEFAEQQGLTK